MSFRGGGYGGGRGGAGFRGGARVRGRGGFQGIGGGGGGDDDSSVVGSDDRQYDGRRVRQHVERKHFDCGSSIVKARLLHPHTTLFFLAPPLSPCTPRASKVAGWSSPGHSWART
jgi:hypothetical protein